MKEGLVGVIVPVYKVEKYIAECIESILAQTYTDFRLILVDDGTPDNAGKICDEYAQKDPRITVIHQENAGVTRARARGVEEASDCEFITFVDGDDKLHKTTLLEFYKKMDSNTDIVMCACYSTEDEPCMVIGSYHNINELDIRSYIKKLILLDGGTPWGKLFRSKLFDTRTFDFTREIIHGEDVIMNLRLAFNSNKNIKIIIEPQYFYRQKNNNSVCKLFKKTIKHEELFYSALKSSVSAECQREYFKITIKNRLKSFYDFWGYKYIVKDMKSTEFYKDLKADIKNNKHKLDFINSIIFYNTCPFIRFFAINLKKTRNLLIRAKQQLLI